MSIYLLVVLVLVTLVVAYLVVENKTSRPDGTLINVHPYRRIMWFLMPTRNESVVYWDFNIRAENEGSPPNAVTARCLASSSLALSAAAHAS